MRKCTRLAALLVAVAGLLGSSAQPAAAEEVTAVVFAGDATAGPGIAFPCINTGTVDTTDCPVLGTSVTAGFAVTGHIPTVARPQLNFGAGANHSTFTFDTNPGACLAADASTTPTHVLGAGTCMKVAAGSVEGYCGLAQGTVFGGYVVNPSNSVPPGAGNRTYNFAGAFTTVAGVAVLTGSMVNTTTGESGLYTGLFTAVPQSPFECLDNTGEKDFTVAGVGVAVLR